MCLLRLCNWNTTWAPAKWDLDPAILPEAFLRGALVLLFHCLVLLSCNATERRTMVESVVVLATEPYGGVSMSDGQAVNYS